MSREVTPSRLRAGTDQRAREPLRRLENEAQSSVPCREITDHLAGFVARPVVDDDQLEIDVCLGEHALKRGSYVSATVADTDDDRDVGHVLTSVVGSASERSP